MKATEVKLLPPRILLYGDYGTGKTFFIGMLHEELKKRGTKGIRLFDFDLSQTLPNFNFDVDIGDTYGKYLTTTGFDAFIREFSQYEEDPDGFGGFAIDSLTTLQQVVMSWVHRKFPQVKRPLSFLSSRQDWGVLIEVFNQILPQLQKISQHSLIVVTAHIRRNPDATGQKEIPLPAVAGSTLPSSLGLWFTEVWLTRVEGTAFNPKYVIQTRPDDMFKCKTQIKDMPGVAESHVVLAKLIETMFAKTAEAAETAEAAKVEA